MQKSASITIVPADQLPNLPEAFRQYVEEFFAEQNIFGRQCYVAFGALDRPSWKGQNQKKGSAPCHSSDLMRYKEGLRGKSLSEWAARAAKQGIIWKFDASWDDGCISPSYDDL